MTSQSPDRRPIEEIRAEAALDAELAAAADDAESNPDAPITDRSTVSRGL